MGEDALPDATHACGWNDLSRGRLLFRRHIGRTRKTRRDSVAVASMIVSHLFPNIETRSPLCLISETQIRLCLWCDPTVGQLAARIPCSVSIAGIGCLVAGVAARCTSGNASGVLSRGRLTPASEYMQASWPIKSIDQAGLGSTSTTSAVELGSGTGSPYSRKHWIWDCSA